MLKSGDKPKVKDVLTVIPSANDELLVSLAAWAARPIQSHPRKVKSQVVQERMDRNKAIIFEDLYAIGGPTIQTICSMHKVGTATLSEWLLEQGMPLRCEWAAGILQANPAWLTEAQREWLISTMYRVVGTHFSNNEGGTIPMVAHLLDGRREPLPFKTSSEASEWLLSLSVKSRAVKAAKAEKEAKKRRYRKSTLPTVQSVALASGESIDMATLAAMLGLLVSEIRKQTKVMAEAWGVPLTVDGDTNDGTDGVA